MVKKNTNSPSMIYNKITLSFSSKEESRFRTEYFFDSILQFRISFVFSIFLYGSFGYLDTRIIPEYAETFQMIRFGFVIPIFSTVLLLSFTNLFERSWQLLLFLSYLAGGIGISIMTMIVPDNYAYYAGMMLIFSAGYFFIKLRFFMASIAGWSTLLIYDIGAIYFTHTPINLLINNNFFFASANLIGMFAAYNIEYYARRNFFLSNKLEIEKSLVLDINKNLEIMVEDRTFELLRAKEKAVESDRLKSAFLANMSHEIRTPMNGILGFSELLKEPTLTGHQQKEYIEIIEKSGIRMLNIINDIVDISKIEAGLMNIEIKDSNINEQIEYIYTFFKPESEAKNIKLSIKTPLELNDAIIFTDREKVYAILTNLVKNALKYTEKGYIEFGYEIEDAQNISFIKFYVRDTGIGIPINRQEAIFERFIQADIIDKMARQGAGLGLSISKAYIEMLGGKIWVESEEDIGTTFYFTLPTNLKPTGASFILQPKPVEKDVKIKKIKILVVEDDEISKELIINYIKTFSNEILIAKTGVDAVNICRENTDIDLILMDIGIPEITGDEATRQIRKFNKNVVIIAQTAYGLSGDKEKAMKAGCTDYIKKPIKKDEFLKMIQKYFGE